MRGSLFFDEDFIAQKVSFHSQETTALPLEKIKDWVKKYCEHHQFFLSSEQEESVYGVVQKHFSILTGGRVRKQQQQKLSLPSSWR